MKSSINKVLHQDVHEGTTHSSVSSSTSSSSDATSASFQPLFRPAPPTSSRRHLTVNPPVASPKKEYRTVLKNLLGTGEVIMVSNFDMTPKASPTLSK